MPSPSPPIFLNGKACVVSHRPDAPRLPPLVGGLGLPSRSSERAPAPVGRAGGRREACRHSSWRQLGHSGLSLTPAVGIRKGPSGEDCVWEPTAGSGVAHSCRGSSSLVSPLPFAPGCGGACSARGSGTEGRALPWPAGAVGSASLHTPSSCESGSGGCTPLRKAALSRVAGDFEK